MWNNPETEEKETWHICTNVASLISVIKKGHRLVQKKECLLLFSMGVGHSIYQLTLLICVFLWKESGRAFFLTKNARKKICVFLLKEGILGSMDLNSCLLAVTINTQHM